MSVRAGPGKFLVTLICTAIFLTWACHLARPQMDHLDLPVCNKRHEAVDAPADRAFNCTWFEEILSKFCDDGNITLETDPVAFVESKSSIWTYVNEADNNITLFYKLCRFFSLEEMDLIDCTHNGTELEVEVEWNKTGVTDLTVFVFTANVYMYDRKHFMGCSKAEVNVAENSGLKLNVTIHNDPPASSVVPAPFPPNNFDPSIDIDNLFESKKCYVVGNIKKCYVVGNITFSCVTNRSKDAVYFKYRFGDGETKRYSFNESLTHTYETAGVFNYRVDAVAVNNHSRAFHAAHSGQIQVLEPVSDISMVVNHENKFEVNVISQVNISAFGTLPIMACWYVKTAESLLLHPVDPGPVHNTTIPPSPICTCRQMTNQSSILEPMQFNEVGSYTFVAKFHNNASTADKKIPFKVIGGAPKAVVASTSTLIVILAFLIALVTVLMIVMGLYIPYRKYKTRFTETANFKFVDLSESTQWDRAKMKVREITEKFNRKRKSSKVGLVNEQQESTRLAQFVTYEAAS